MDTTQVSRIKVLIGIRQERLTPEELLLRAKMRAVNAAENAKHKQVMRLYYASHPEDAALCPWYLNGAK
jgi:hypothetical protein